MGYWKSKVLPKIKKVFEKNGTKKTAAAEACKSFDGSKEEINKEFEEKKTDLQPKVLEIYESSAVEIKTVVKERTDEGVKKHSAGVTKFLEELAKIDFPGSKLASEASSKYGPVLVSGPVFFVFEKVATFIPIEEPVAAETTAATLEEAPAPVAEESSSKEEVVAVVEEKEKKEEPEKSAPVAEAITEATEPAKAAEGEEASKA